MHGQQNINQKKKSKALGLIDQYALDNIQE